MNEQMPAGLPFELDSLSKAQNYQKWVYDTVRPFLGSRILELGAGIGNMSQWLPLGQRLILTETEAHLLPLLRKKAAEKFGEQNPKVSVESLFLPSPKVLELEKENLDTIISFNVLEHIEDDAQMLGQLAAILRASSSSKRRLVSFVPAQSWAMSDMDRRYGHFRRYSKKRIFELSRSIVPEAKVYLRSFNAIGLLGWVWSTKILKQKDIKASSVKAFDMLCPYIRHLDDSVCGKLGYPWGQSFIWVLELP